MTNQNIVILGLQGTGSTYLVTSMWEILHSNNYYYDELRQLYSRENFYNSYKKLFNHESNWCINLQTSLEYQQFLKALAEPSENTVFGGGKNIWTILLIRKDFLDIYLTWLIRRHTGGFLHMTRNSKKEILNWKKGLLLSKEIMHTDKILNKWKDDVIAFVTALKNWPRPINNVVIYESLLGDYSLQDRKLILKGLEMGNNILTTETQETDVIKIWQNREEKLNAM